MDIVSFILGMRAGGGGTDDYEQLNNLPKINDVELKGNKSLSDLGIDMDEWTNTAQVDSNGEVAFTGLSDNYAYSLFVENKLVSITSVTKTGSGSNVTLTYALSGAETGDVCKLRIVK